MSLVFNHRITVQLGARGCYTNIEVCLHLLHLPAPDIMLVAVQMVQTACTTPAPSAPPLALCPALSAPHTATKIQRSHVKKEPHADTQWAMPYGDATLGPPELQRAHYEPHPVMNLHRSQSLCADILCYCASKIPHRFSFCW